MISFKLAILALAGISNCSAEYRDLKDMPDCSVAKNKSSAECICRLPMNWSKSICQGPKWFGDPERQEDSETGIRIVGGIPVDAGVYPWFARSAFNRRWGGCGGSLVSPEYVLTAAHCIDNISSIKEYGGYQIGALCFPFGPFTYNCQQKSESFGIKEIIMHPRYDMDDSHTNDFALVRLDGRSSITPVRMDAGDVSPLYETECCKGNLWPIGFGDLEQSGSRDLMHVNINYVKQEDCRRAYPRENIRDNMLCAADSGQGSCQGDSGGPLYDSDNETLVGVVSWGYNCANDRYPGVYSRISDQIAWIQQTICESHSSPKPAFCSLLPPQTACIDSPVGWNDKDGSFYDCMWYADGYCEMYGDNNELKNLGKTANEACCVCGGGLEAVCACGKETSRSAVERKSNSISEDHLPSPTPDTTKKVLLGSKSSTSDAIIRNLADWLRSECIKSTTDTSLMIEYATMFHDLGLDSAYAIKDLLDKKTLHEFSWMKDFHKRAVENCLV